MEYFLLAFPGFPGNSGIEKEPRVLEIIVNQLQALVHKRKSPESEEHFPLVFLSVSSLSRKPRNQERARDM